MAKNVGRAGKSAREMAAGRRKRAINAAMVSVGLIVLFIVVINKIPGSRENGILIFGLIFLMVVVWKLFERRIDRGLRAEKRAIRGAKGEEKVASNLDELDENYYILHDVESPYGNIDHIIISKFKGVFLIETKAHGGKVSVENDNLLINGKVPEKNFISQALKNTYWLRDEIGDVAGEKPWITPVIVFSNAFVPRTPPIKGVSIINKKYLRVFLERNGKSNPKNQKIWEYREEISDLLV